MHKNIIYGLVDPETKHLRYVGMSTRGMRRPKEHGAPWRLRREAGFHKTRWIKTLLAKGLEYKIIVIQEFEDSELLGQAEMFWIAYFKAMRCPLTNDTLGGPAPTLGKKLTPEQRAAIGKRTLGTKRSEETKARIGIAQIGKINSPEARAKMSAAKKGKVPMHLIEANRKFKVLEDERGGIYRTVKEAARALDVSVCAIYQVLRGERRSTNGHTLVHHVQ